MLNIIITNISTNMSYMSKEKMYINEENKNHVICGVHPKATI